MLWKVRSKAAICHKYFDVSGMLGAEPQVANEGSQSMDPAMDAGLHGDLGVVPTVE